MGNQETPKTPPSPLRQLCDRAKLGDEAKALLTDAFSTKDFIAFLVKKEMYRDALRLVAFLLPKREAIGWGCLCVRHALGGEKDKPLPDVHLAAERWVSAPNDENRWKAKQLADSEKPTTASGLLASAVFFAGPSISPPNVQAVPPPEQLTSELVANAVVIAGLVKEPDKAKEKYRVFMEKATVLMVRMAQAPKQ